jgi:hypothetical protein
MAERQTSAHLAQESGQCQVCLSSRLAQDLGLLDAEKGWGARCEAPHLFLDLPAEKKQKTGGNWSRGKDYFFEICKLIGLCWVHISAYLVSFALLSVPAVF